jgi:hypothetical protein
MMTHCFPMLAFCLVAAAIGAERPMSLVCNGGCEQSLDWSLAAGKFADGGNPGRCLRVAGAGGATRYVLVARRELTLTATVDLLVHGVRAHQG